MPEDTGITVRYDDVTYRALRARAHADKVSIAEVVRRAVERYLTAPGSETGSLRLAVDEALRPHVNRLAALTSKAVIQAASAKWLAAAITEHLAELSPEAVPAYPDQDGLLEDVRHYALEDLKARRQAETVTEAEAQRMVEAGPQTP